MKNAYPVIFTQTHDEKDTVLIEVPDWEILTEGFGTADAIYMARDAIGIAGISKEDNGEVLPEPSNPKEIDADAGEFKKDGDCFVSMVDINFTEYRKLVDNKTVRRNVTLPNWLNVAAEKAHLNVSKVLQEALMERVGMQK